MYIINKYRKDMPLPKRIFEDILFKIRFAFLYLKNNFKAKSILFYPHYPSKRSTIHKITNHLGYNRTNNPNLKHKLIIHYEMQTFRKARLDAVEILKKTRVINYACDDISKEHVEKIFTQTFGYGTFIDPLTFQGEAVKKNNINAMHDGVIIDCPIDHLEPGYIYQKLINNRYDNNLVEDLRITIINYNPVLCQIKRRPEAARFSRQTSETFLVNPDEAITGTEKQKINQFCTGLCLEFGSLDVLRDRNDKRIYIVDANNTPHGPAKLNKKEARLAVQILADAFEKEYLILSFT
jgi:hypothetical protein